jgi:hypothetical protein
MKKYPILFGILFAFLTPGFSQDKQQVDQDDAYTKVITQRAEKIVKPIKIKDDAKATAVLDLIVQHYRDLSEIHDTRDARIEEIEKQAGEDEEKADKKIYVIEDAASSQLYRLRVEFVSKLSQKLSPEQVDQVKDGMTYGVVPITYDGYLAMLPDLTEEQKDQIMAYLVEARDYAMTGGSSEDKHGWFGKYKGKINNYLSDAGYELNKAGKEWKKRREAASAK